MLSQILAQSHADLNVVHSTGEWEWHTSQDGNHQLNFSNGKVLRTLLGQLPGSLFRQILFTRALLSRGKFNLHLRVADDLLMEKRAAQRPRYYYRHIWKHMVLKALLGF